jgi:histidyl-tRNA synthetase
MSTTEKPGSQVISPRGSDTAAGGAPRATRLQAVRGMNDVLPDEAPLWQRVEDAARTVFAQYGYRNLRVPVVEATALFVRGIGDATDIVEKEMYTFADRLNGDSLTLRPEATAGIVIAAIEHSLTYERPQRVWTMGPMFRHERPQKGRYRQFHQLDAEALGFEGPDDDAEQIMMLARLWKVLGLLDVSLKINSIGDADDRLRHRALLIEHFERHRDVLDADAERRLHANPLRLLDSKHPPMQEAIRLAPRLIDRIGAPARAHFEGLTAALDAAGIAYEVDARLVRGLDYYNRTVFEWVTGALGAQGASAHDAPLAYVAHAGDAASRMALAVAESLRDRGHAVVVHAGGGSLKSQMKRADASGAAVALIIGDDEVAAGTVTLKPLRVAAPQSAVAVADVAARAASYAA